MAVRSWNLVQGKGEMTKVVDGTKVPHHGLFYMENAGGYGDEPETPKSAATDERQPGCFVAPKPVTLALVYLGL
jgi:hypothetical protein